MEFWGVEVKPGQAVKCEPGDERFLHLSQASLGEVKKDKGTESVPIFVKINDEKLVIGTLSAENCTQIQYDVIFEKEFELSHGSKSSSVFFVGYKSTNQGYESEDDIYDSDSEDELQIDQKAKAGKVLDKSNQKKATVAKVVPGRDDTEAGKAKAKTGKPDNIDSSKAAAVQEGDEDDSEDDEEESDEDDEELPKSFVESDDDEIDEDDSSEDEEANLKEKKRPADGKLKSSVPVKKNKVEIPSGSKKAGDEVKKGGQTAIPNSAKQAGKTPTADKSKQQTPKSVGSVVCKSCNKSFYSEKSLQDHTKAKHSGSK